MNIGSLASSAVAASNQWTTSSSNQRAPSSNSNFVQTVDRIAGDVVHVAAAVAAVAPVVGLIGGIINVFV
ncbi:MULTISPECIES: hypothetical protein [Burkholderiaceae]|uniref:Uncharacterized protein n=2 Tax=Paraburkholderia TaxID=1822464 RepID=A0A7Y9WXF5_9BURK|nr:MULTISPECIES: hypothetical protein [Burkholderiaceae]NYH27728.1 hypothetical protein [Paraburkholderia bryophila]